MFNMCIYILMHSQIWLLPQKAAVIGTSHQCYHYRLIADNSAYGTPNLVTVLPFGQLLRICRQYSGGSLNPCMGFRVLHLYHDICLPPASLYLFLYNLQCIAPHLAIANSPYEMLCCGKSHLYHSLPDITVACGPRLSIRSHDRMIS